MAKAKKKVKRYSASEKKEILDFITKKGQPVSPLGFEQLQSARNTLFAEYGLSQLQAAESAALAEAMVIRVALGLSAAWRCPTGLL